VGYVWILELKQFWLSFTKQAVETIVCSVLLRGGWVQK